MSKYIKLEDAIEALYSGFVTKTYIENKLKDLPTIDIEYCDDCADYDTCDFEFIKSRNGYCSFGERIDNE